MTKSLSFDAGHRLMNHESKCGHVHGHRYVVDVTLEWNGALDRAGRIVDFGEVKARLGGWIDANLDHAFIGNDADPIAQWLKSQGQHVHLVPFEPSAENLAQYLLHIASMELSECGAHVVSVVVHETPTSLAMAMHSR